MDASEIFDRLMNMRKKIEHDTGEQLGDSDDALLYDVSVALGLSREQASVLAGDSPNVEAATGRREFIRQSAQDIIEEAKKLDSIPPCHDFDHIGAGIGGINRIQPTAAEELALIDAQMRHTERESKRVRRGPLPNGQLWEPCPICGNEPVCLDCGVCDRHCDC